MKCDELTDRWFWAYPTESVDCDGITGSAHEVYSKYEVDEAIAELKEENESLLHQNRELCQALQVMYSKEEYGKLQKELESLKASHYAEMVDAGMRERRLRRALWLARAERAKEMCQRLLIQGFDPKWENVERKCLAKADMYK